MVKKISDSQREIIIENSGGQVRVFGPAFPEEIIEMDIDATLNSFRQPESQKKSLAEIAALDEGQVYLAVNENNIVGYVTFHPPEPFERWGEGEVDCILELGAIEVSRHFRGAGLAFNLMDVAFFEGNMDDYIVIATEYYWHWDLEGTGLPLWEYRRVLESIMTSVGMEPKETNDPEINSHPVNVLMVKVGANVSEENIAAFEELCHKPEESMNIYL